MNEVVKSRIFFLILAGIMCLADLLYFTFPNDKTEMIVFGVCIASVCIAFLRLVYVIRKIKKGDFDD